MLLFLLPLEKNNFVVFFSYSTAQRKMVRWLMHYDVEKHKRSYRSHPVHNQEINFSQFMDCNIGDHDWEIKTGDAVLVWRLFVP